MKQRLYLDTSVPSAYYDDEKPERQKVTQGWWGNEMGKYELVISRVTLDELEATKDVDRRNKFLGLVEGIEILPITKECRLLANKYIENDSVANVFQYSHLSQTCAAYWSIVVVVSGKTLKNVSYWVENDIIPENCFNDALHIAIVTINNIDILVSWNFAHLVNINTRHKVKGVNLLNDYSEIEIVSPLEIGGGKYVWKW